LIIQSFLLFDFNIGKTNNDINPSTTTTNTFTLQECKEWWASAYDKTWQDVKDDFEYAIGISKRYSFEEVMDEVAEMYKHPELIEFEEE